MFWTVTDQYRPVASPDVRSVAADRADCGVTPLMENRSWRSDSVSFYSHFPIFCSIAASRGGSVTEERRSARLSARLSARRISRSRFLSADVCLVPANN